MLKEWQYDCDYIGIKVEPNCLGGYNNPRRFARYQYFCLRRDLEFATDPCVCKVSADVEFLIDGLHGVIDTIPARIVLTMIDMELRGLHYFLEIIFSNYYYTFSEYCGFHGEPYAIREDGTTVGNIPVFESQCVEIGLEGCYEEARLQRDSYVTAYTDPPAIIGGFFSQGSHKDVLYPILYERVYQALNYDSSFKQELAPFDPPDYRYVATSISGSYYIGGVLSAWVRHAPPGSVYDIATAYSLYNSPTYYYYWPSLGGYYNSHDKYPEVCIGPAVNGPIYKMEYINNDWSIQREAYPQELCGSAFECWNNNNIPYNIAQMITFKTLVYDNNFIVVDINNKPKLQDAIGFIFLGGKCPFVSYIYELPIEQDGTSIFDLPSDCFDYCDSDDALNGAPPLTSCRIQEYHTSDPDKQTVIDRLKCVTGSNCSFPVTFPYGGYKRCYIWPMKLTYDGSCWEGRQVVAMSRVILGGPLYYYIEGYKNNYPYKYPRKTFYIFRYPAYIASQALPECPGCSEYAWSELDSPAFYNARSEILSQYTQEYRREHLECYGQRQAFAILSYFCSSIYYRMSLGSYWGSGSYRFMNDYIYISCNIKSDIDLRIVLSTPQRYTIYGILFNYTIGWLRPNDDLSLLYGPLVDCSLDKLEEFVDRIDVGSFSIYNAHSSCPDHTFAITWAGCLYQSPVDLACAPTSDYEPYYMAIGFLSSSRYYLEIPNDDFTTTYIDCNITIEDAQSCVIESDVMNAFYSVCNSCNVCYTYTYIDVEGYCRVFIYFRYH